MSSSPANGVVDLPLAPGEIRRSGPTRTGGDQAIAAPGSLQELDRETGKRDSPDFGSPDLSAIDGLRGGNRARRHDLTGLQLRVIAPLRQHRQQVRDRT